MVTLPYLEMLPYMEVLPYMVTVTIYGNTWKKFNYGTIVMTFDVLPYEWMNFIFFQLINMNGINWKTHNMQYIQNTYNFSQSMEKGRGPPGLSTYGDPKIKETDRIYKK